VPDVGDNSHEVLIVSDVIDASDIDLSVLLLVGRHLLDDQLKVG